ncbi:MAG TPA: DNA internalization-related competence protein ComEC/Rec2 [Rhodothermales bacterium]
MQPSIHGERIHLSAYPALLLFSGLAAGIWIEYARTVQGSALWMAVAAGSGGCFILSAWWSQERLVSLARLCRYGAACLLTISAGGIRAAQFAEVGPLDVSRLLEQEGLEVAITGRTLATPVLSHGRARFILIVDSVGANSGVEMRAAVGRVYVTVRDANPISWVNRARGGSRIGMWGRLEPTRPPRNPAEFDFRRYLAQKGVRSMLRVDTGYDVRPLGPPSNLVRRVAVSVERRVESTIERRVPTATGRGILIALLLGRRSEMDPEVLDSFARTGLLHILAVSGLHVLMVGMVVYNLLCPFLLRFRLRWRTMELVRAVVTLALLTVYAVVTGGSASVTRSVVMTAVLIGGVAFQRSAPAINSLAVAGCFLVLQRPTYLWDIGFQLSFGAVAAIVLLQPALMEPVRARLDEDTWQWSLAQGIATSTAATIGTAPILLYHFGSVSVAGLVLNPIAIPASGLALSGGLLTVLWAGLAPISAAFGQSADLFSHVLVKSAVIGDRILGWATIDAHLTYPPFVIALIAATGVLAVIPAPRTRWRLTLAAAGAVALGMWTTALTSRALPMLDVVFLDVGQGDGAFIRFPNGRTMVIDVGPRDTYFDAGRSVIVPHVQRYAPKGIDVVVVTHPHSDHLGGLPAVLRSMPVRRYVHNGDAYESELFRETAHLVDSLAITTRAVQAGDTLLIDPRVRVHVLAPTPVTALEPNPNDRSVVLRLEFGSTTFLLAGDSERAAENALLGRFRAALASEVVKVGHHGSQTSSQPSFVTAVTQGVDETFAVVSVAERNRFGLPDEVVLDRWLNAGARLHVTSEGGALWLRSDGRSVRVVRWRDD